MKLIYLSTARVPDEWAHVIQIMKMCEAFARSGMEVELLVPMRARTRREDPFAYAGVEPIFRIRKLPCIDIAPGTQDRFLYWVRTLSFLACARIYLLAQRYDTLYTRELLAARLPKAVLELHTFSASIAKTADRLRGRKMVTISRGIQEELVARGIDADLVCVASDGVDLAAFAHPEPKAAARARLGIPQDARVALYAGLLEAWKGTDTLYAAAALLHPDIDTVVIGGEASELDALRAAHPHIRFLGFRPYRELADNQAVADVLVLPNSGTEMISARYTSPLKLFTYMASGVPIVASDLPSLREILDDSNAVLVSPDDPAALAAGIRYAFDHSEEAHVRSAKARRDVEAYTWDTRAQRILSFLGQGTPVNS